MKIFFAAVKSILLIILLLGCQAVFTYSPFSAAQRDISDLPDDQKVTRAEDVLSTGDTEAITEAYDAIQEMLADDPDNTELNLLAAELALGASGINDVVEEVFMGGEDFDIDSALESLDAEILSDVAEHVSHVLDNGEDVPDDVLVVAAATSVLDAVNNDEDLTELSDWDPASGEPLVSDVPELVDASVFILAMNDSSEITNTLTDFFENNE